MMDNNVIQYVTDRLTQEVDRAHFADIGATIKVQHNRVVFVEVTSTTKLRPEEIDKEKRD